MEEKIERNNEIDVRTEPERAADRKIETLEMELANLQPGVQVILERLRPSWCKGQLEKITIGDEGLDLDYLIRTWGGHLLSVKIVGTGGRIKGSHTVELYTFEPRRYGKTLRQPGMGDDEDETGIVMQSAAPPTQNPFNSFETFKGMMEMMNQSRQSEIDTLRSILAIQLQQNQTAPAPSAVAAANPMSELLKAANYYKQLEGLFGPKEPVAAEDQFPGQIMEMAKMFFESRGQNPPAQLTDPRPAPKLSAVRPVSVPPPAPPPVSATPKPAQNPSSMSGPPQNDVVSQLSGMDPNSAAETLILALNRMKPEQQDRTIEAFMDKFRETMPEFFEEDEDAADEEDKSGGQ